MSEMRLEGLGKFHGAGYIEGVGGSLVCVKGTGIIVSALADRFAAGESIHSLADDYELPEWQVESCLRLFLCSLSGRHGYKVENTMRGKLQPAPVRDAADRREPRR